jgi:hypothetical protein
VLTAGVADDDQAQLLELAEKRLEELTENVVQSTLDAVLKRLFDPDRRDLLTVCAFGSSL